MEDHFGLNTLNALAVFLYYIHFGFKLWDSIHRFPLLSIWINGSTAALVDSIIPRFEI